MDFYLRIDGSLFHIDVPGDDPQKTLASFLKAVEEVVSEVEEYPLDGLRWYDVACYLSDPEIVQRLGEKEVCVLEPPDLSPRFATDGDGYFLWDELWRE